MVRSRRWTIVALLLVSVLTTVALLMLPLADTRLLTVETDATYMNICGVLAKDLSRVKNVGLALTLFAMALGFGGVLITALITPMARTMGVARNVIAALSGALVLVPLAQLLLGAPSLLGAIGLASNTGVPPEGLSIGCYLTMALALGLIVLSALGMPVRRRTPSGAARPMPAAAARPQRSGGDGQKRAQDAQKKTGGPEADDDAETTVIRTAAGPVGGTIVGISGSYAGGVIELGQDEEILFGRSPRVAHVVIMENNADISRRHCAVRADVRSGRYLVTDYSRNGTFARTKGQEEELRLPAKKPAYLAKGTILRLGRRGNEFRLD